MTHYTRLLLLLTLFLSVALSSPTVRAESDSTGQFSGWTTWAARTGNGAFALDLCKSLQVGDVNGDGYTDLICPYDYGSASTATFVQLSDGASFSGWTTWAARTGNGAFALDLCKSLQVGDVNGDGYTDLICPYDYGSASTATFVQLSDGASFSGWTTWAARTGNGSFALDLCKSLQVGRCQRRRVYRPDLSV